MAITDREEERRKIERDCVWPLQIGRKRGVKLKGSVCVAITDREEERCKMNGSMSPQQQDRRSEK